MDSVQEDWSEVKMEDEENKPVVHSETLKIALSQLLDMYIDEEYFNLAQEVGKQLRWGELEAMGILSDVPNEYQIVDTPGTDIFGVPLSKKYNFECECPKCHRTLAASRFAPHLEKCMGKGRNRSRIASRRLAASSNSNSNHAVNNSATEGGKAAAQGGVAGAQGPNPLNGELESEDDHFEKEDDDEDWSLDSNKKKSKKAIEKPVKRKGLLSRVKNADGVDPKGQQGVSPSVTDSPASL